MNKVKGLFLTVLAACLTLPGLALAAGPAAAPIVIVSDTRKFEGLLKTWGDIYNHSHMEFTILTCLLIPIVGCGLGLFADWVMGFVGIDLKSRDLAEK
jgi:hypothetical protein